MLWGRFESALAFATQARKGTRIPYLSHLLAVSALVLESGGDEDQAIAALRHDAVEDQGGRPALEEIRRRYGDRVAAIVEGCSDTDVIPKPPWKERKQAYVDHLAEAQPDVLLVSLADKVHNLRSIVLDHRFVDVGRHADDMSAPFWGTRVRGMSPPAD
ncbi:MAG TPA: HD domain-containing protein [Gammaproteobacteria bacterium]|nr:HD domain-containing protein [Gammaproteobacteria bacterium]